MNMGGASSRRKMLTWPWTWRSSISVEPHSAVEAAAWLQADDRAVGIFLNGLAALGLLTKGWITSRTAGSPLAS